MEKGSTHQQWLKDNKKATVKQPFFRQLELRTCIASHQYAQVGSAVGEDFSESNRWSGRHRGYSTSIFWGERSTSFWLQFGPKGRVPASSYSSPLIYFYTRKYSLCTLGLLSNTAQRTGSGGSKQVQLKTSYPNTMVDAQTNELKRLKTEMVKSALIMIIIKISSCLPTVKLVGC